MKIEQTINYAINELNTLKTLLNEGKLTENGALIRVFFLGKSLIGWQNDSEKSDEEQVQMLLKVNKQFTSIMDEVSRKRAS